MTKNKGLFIVFEGPDRSGKTTQINLLASYLKSKKIKFILTREPGGCRLSEQIRDILLNPSNEISPISELMLYEAARAQHVAEKILPALKKGKIVISDRFFLATLAYQGYGRQIELPLIRRLNSIAALNIKPDITFLFTMPDSEFKKRTRPAVIDGKIDRIEREKESFRKKVNLAYKKLAKSERNIIEIDATNKIEDISAFIRRYIERKLKIK